MSSFRRATLNCAPAEKTYQGLILDRLRVKTVTRLVSILDTCLGGD